MSDAVKRLETAREAVALASVVCRGVQADLEGVRTALKDDRSPVTVADYASQAVVAHVLSRELGKVTLVAEESATELRAQLEAGQRETLDRVLAAVSAVWPGATLESVLDMIDLGSADPPRDALHGFWTLDPIDGTKGFLRGEQYAVSLAWVEGGTPVVAALGCPNLPADFGESFDEPDPHGRLFLAIKGDGCSVTPCDQPEADREPVLRLEPAEGEPVRVCESKESEHTAQEVTAEVMRRLGNEAGEASRLDSQAKYAVVARGQADLYLRLPRPPKPGKPRYVERIWDHAAGALIATESGCAVTDALGNQLDFGLGRGLEKNRGVVVGAPRVHGAAIGAIRDVGAAPPDG